MPDKQLAEEVCRETVKNARKLLDTNRRSMIQFLDTYERLYERINAAEKYIDADDGDAFTSAMADALLPCLRIVDVLTNNMEWFEQSVVMSRVRSDLVGLVLQSLDEQEETPQ